MKDFARPPVTNKKAIDSRKFITHELSFFSRFYAGEIPTAASAKRNEKKRLSGNLHFFCSGFLLKRPCQGACFYRSLFFFSEYFSSLKTHFLLRSALNFKTMHIEKHFFCFCSILMNLVSSAASSENKFKFQFYATLGRFDTF